MSRSEAAALLDVPADASPDEVQHAYLRAARRTHPDLVPESDEAGRRAASAAFARLTLARDVLAAPAPTIPEEDAGWRPGPEGAAGPHYRRVEGRGLAGSLVVLALLAFLLVALVSLQQAFLAPLPGPPSPPPPASTTP